MNNRIFITTILFILLLLPWIFGINNFDSIETYLFSSIKTVTYGLFLLLIILLISWIFDQVKETVVFPFNNVTGDDKYNGVAISESLIVELQRIIRIHSETRPEMNIESLPYSLKVQFHKLKLNISDDLRSQSQSLASSITTMGIMSLGDNRIDIGSMIVSIKRLLPSRFRGGYISGCMQKYGSSARLTANLEYNGKIYAVENTRDNFVDALLPVIIQDLAFNILYNLTTGEKKSNNILINFVKRHFGLFMQKIKVITEKHPQEIIRANSWIAFKYFSKTLDSYNKYYYSNNKRDLNRARSYCEHAAKIQTNYPILSVLFTYLGLSYYKLEEYPEAIEMFEQALKIEDSSDIRCLLGLTFRYLHRFREAMDCASIAMQANPKSPLPYKLKGDIYLDLSCYASDLLDKSIKFYSEAIKADKAFVIGYYSRGNAKYRKGLYNEAIEDLNNSIRNAEKSHFPKYDEPRISLAACYRKLEDDDNCESELKKVAPSIAKINIYGRACFEAISLNDDDAIYFLKISLKNKFVSPIDVRYDPDIDFLRNNRNKDLEELLNKCEKIEKKEVTKHEAIRKLLSTENEYIRASFEASVNNDNVAINLIHVALSENITTMDKIKRDPHFKSIYKNITNNFQKSELSPHFESIYKNLVRYNKSDI